MINLPEYIFSYMASRSLNFEGPAYIEVETDGTIIKSGGELKKFSLDHVEINGKLGQFIDIFEGFFPFFVDEVELPLVEISQGVYSDIYIFRFADKITVLFIDSSKSGESIQNFYQNRNEKMLFADSQLSFKEDPALFQLFKSLDTVVLEKIDSDTFQLMGKAPRWVTSLNPNEEGIVKKEKLFERYPFIEIFIQTAMEFWEKNNTGMFPSDIWTEIDANNDEYYMDAKAISILTRKFLLLQHSHAAAQEKFKLIQRARELSLEHELRIKAEQQLNIKNEKLRELNATKDKFFSIIAHDLRNPIGAFRNLVELFSFYYDTMSSDEIHKTIELLEKQTIVLHRLLDNLLHWSRSQMEVIQFNPVETEFYGMSESIISLYSFSAKEKGIDLINKVPRTAVLQCDQDLVSVVLRNLISNSIKFTEKGGKVEILLEQDERGAKVTIRDTGIGMSPDDLDKLFKIEENYTRYGTSNEKGTGLGLILCKEFIEKHGGTMNVESKIGEGSEFSFTIPKYEK